MANFLELTVAGLKLEVRRFSVREELNEHYRCTVWCRFKSPEIDLESCVGQKAEFTIRTLRGERTWHGGVAKCSLVRPETAGESTYLIEIAPPLWFTSQVRNRRIFQHMKVPDIVDAVLKPYDITPKRELGEEYKDLEYVVQYGETDFEFINRLLQDAGIAYRYDFGPKTELVVTDAPEEVPKTIAIPYVDEPNPDARENFATKVRLAHRVTPGKVTIRDFSFKKKLDYPLIESHEAKDFKDFEQYFYMPQSMLVEKGGRGPKVADDEGTARHLQSVGRAKAERRLGSLRRGRRSVGFTTNVVTLSPGKVFAIEEHPHKEIGDGDKLLITAFTCDGSPSASWVYTGEAYFVKDGYEPALKAKKTKIPGVQSAIVTGPKGEEIYTDEYGRVRAQFQWDREGEGIKAGKAATKWMRVNQPWAGRRMGTVLLPRIGHEVLVRYFEGDPEAPAVVGRVYNKLQPVPYPLPKHEIKAVWKTDTTPHAEDSYNEIRLDDRLDLELFYTQAQRDREELVRRHEFERTGVNRVGVVGKNRSTIVGEKDSTMVGKCYSVQVVKPPSEKGLHLLDQKMPELDPTATKLTMVHEKIFATTGDSTVEMDDDEIVFEAKGEISIKGRMVIIEGGPNVKINCGSSHSGDFGAGGALAPSPKAEDKSWFTWIAEKLGFAKKKDEPINPAAASMLADFPEESQRIASKSPTLTKQLEQLEKDGWTIEKGPADGGSYADRSAKKIVIADDGDTPKGIVSTTAHEVGHAVYGAPPYHAPTGMTKQDYIDANVAESLKDEGFAQFNTNVARDEIMSNGGPDIGIPGGGDYKTPYKDFKAGKISKDGAIDKMADTMGNEVTSTTGENYKDYYGKPYDEHYDKVMTTKHP